MTANPNLIYEDTLIRTNSNWVRSWFARDEGLKDGADTCARGVTVAAFFNRPRAVDDADDHVGGGRDAFFSDDELELANTAQNLHLRLRLRIPGARAR